MFQCQVGRWGAFFRASKFVRIEVSGEVLRLWKRDGAAVEVAASDLVPGLSLRKGMTWSRIDIATGQHGLIRLKGLPKADAIRLMAILEPWLLAVRAAVFCELDARLAQALQQLDALWDQSGFVRHSRRAQVAERAFQILDAAAADVGARDCPPETQARAQRLKERCEQAEALTAAANERFVELALKRYGPLFDAVEANPLTDAQRRACVRDDDNNLVLAGAGTGKTSVMVGRLAYLVAAGIAAPKEVLLVAFNRDAAEELRERVAARIPELDGGAVMIKTFHALGKEIIAAVDGRQPNLAAHIDDGVAFRKRVDGYLETLLQDGAYLAAFLDYGFDGEIAKQSIFDFESMEDYERALNRQNMRTLGGEWVKSLEEVRIANFLLRNGVSYTYEQPFELAPSDRDRRQYRPDFTIHRPAELGGDLYLEHFAVDRMGRPPAFFGEAGCLEYVEGMARKRQLFVEHQRTLLETYSHEFWGGTPFVRLAAELKRNGVELTPLSDEACIEALRESGLLSEVSAQFVAWIPLVRDAGWTTKKTEQALSGVPELERPRVTALWSLLQPVVELYEKDLAATQTLDFTDLITLANDYLARGLFQSPFKQILVDEFQDISAPRAALVLNLRAARCDTAVFCVGDDWQSIYRFAGSDVRWTTEFFARFGPGATTALDQTFRFNSQIGRVASQFVGKNPLQMKKEIRSRALVDQPAVSLVATAEPQRALMAILGRINGWAKATEKTFSVFVLGRYGYEVDQIQAEMPTGWRRQFAGLSSVAFRTVHGSKGLEADFVVLVGLEEGRGGFPADKGRDWFEEMVLPKLEEYPFAEERRLFYVALTRARHRVYLVFDRYTSSPFVTELESGEFVVETQEFQTEFIQSDVRPQPCPRCATGKVIPRSGQDGKAFYGCNRFPVCKYRDRGCGSCSAPLQMSGDYRVCTSESCDGVHLGCPRCGAPMLSRTSQYGPFFGCSNFGRVDIAEQCLGKSPWRELPSAAELRRSGPGAHVE